MRRMGTAAKIVAQCPARIRSLLEVSRVDKPIGTHLLFWPGAWGIGIASGFNLSLLVPFAVGAFVMRGAGCTINDLWDRKLDRAVERTRNRPLASGALTVPLAMAWLAAQLSVGLAILVQLHPTAIALGVASMIPVTLYPLAKRVTDFPQAVLALTFNMGIPMGYAAATGALSLPIVAPLYSAALAWTLFYDTIYAHQDKRDDVKVGVRSTALRFGDDTKTYLSGFAVAMVSLLTLTGYNAGLSVPYYVGVGLSAYHLHRQIRQTDLDSPEMCASAFRSNAQIGFIVASAIFVSV